MDFSQSGKMYNDYFQKYNLGFFFARIFSVKKQTDNDEAGSCNAVTVVGLERRMCVGRSGSGSGLH